MLSPETIAQAQKDQAKTWEAIGKEFTFFKKTEEPIFLDVFGLDNWSIYRRFGLYHAKALELGYPVLARYWASSFLDYHVFYMWNVDFEIARSSGLDVKKASVQADKQKVERVKLLKERYP